MDRDALNNPQNYPRIYRLRRNKRAFYMFVGFSGFLLAILTIGIAKTSHDIPNVLFGAGFLYTIFGLSSIIDALRYRLILHFNRIELYTLFFRHRTVLRDHLAYIDWLVFERETAMDWASNAPPKIAGIRPALIRKDKRTRPLIFLDQIRTDEFFDRWLSALRNAGSRRDD